LWINRTTEHLFEFDNERPGQSEHQIGNVRKSNHSVIISMNLIW
jgi:hypothetical protein